jgi:hypothetical protein
VKSPLLALALLAAGCSMTTPSSASDLEISNQTTLAVTLVVNGTKVREVAPGTVERVVPGQLPAQPWNVEARSPSGRVLSTLTVRSGDVIRTASGWKGDAQRVDLSCGRLDMWSGPPLLGPPPGSGAPGDCRP